MAGSVLFPGHLWSSCDLLVVFGPRYNSAMLISIQNLKNIIFNHWFSVATLAAIGLAAWAPESGSHLNPDGMTRILVILMIFFLTGLNLQTTEVLGGVACWRVHLAVQLFIYGIFPLVSWILIQPFREMFGNELLMGYILLIILPTTVTSCVVFTELSGGDTSVALFNAIFGNLLGIFLTPLLFIMFLGASISSIEIDILSIITRVVSLTILPFLVGQMCRTFWSVGRQPWVKHANSVGIILIVFFSFCRTFAADEPVLRPMAIIFLVIYLVFLHFMMLLLSWGWASVLGFAREIRITALFCCSQKTLTLGLPLISACLEFKPAWLGFVSLPLIIYHGIQLGVSGFIRDLLVSKVRANT